MAPKGAALNRAYAYAAVIIGLLIFILVALLTDIQPYFAWIAGWSLSLFLLYGFDKAQAVRQGWRVPEMLLHALALIGGFIGGWLGMFMFRHKTRKPIFKVVLAVATVLHAVIFYLLIVRQ